jgi:anti-sigma-K factor RskA
MFWDQSVDAWTFVAHHLPAPKPGRTYQLWLVTPTSKISAGTFAPGTNGDAVVRAKYALPKNALAAVAVTDEPDSGSAQPTTAPFMVGTKAGN